MITPEEAERIGRRWVSRSSGDAEPALHEFDLGWVVTPRTPDERLRPVGEGRGVVDRRTGELSVWPSLPVEGVVAAFREQYVDPPPPRAWDPLRQTRRDLARAIHPATVTVLTVGDRVFSARTAKGDGELRHHPMVAAFYDVLPTRYRERGCERASEAVAISDALLAEQARRDLAGEPGLTVREVREEFFRDGTVETTVVREPGDPVDGTSGPASVPTLLLLGYLGFHLARVVGSPPVDAGDPEEEP